MLIRTRFIILVFAAILALCAVFAIAFWQRDLQLSERYHASLLHAQHLAWNKLESENIEALGAAAAALVTRPGWSAAWRAGDRGGLADQIEPVLRLHTSWRVDVYNAHRDLVYSTAPDLTPTPLLDAAAVGRVLGDGRRAGSVNTGLTLTSNVDYFWVHAMRFGDDAQGGVVALAADADAQLPDVANSVGGVTYLANLRGRAMVGTSDLRLVPGDDRINVRRDSVDILEGTDGRTLLMVSHPVTGVDHRPVAALVSLQDVSARARADLRFAVLVLAGGLLFVVVFVCVLYVTMREAFEPLDRAVGVLGSLAQGDLDASLDEGDEELDDEAGAVARGVASLRTEMLSLQMLRDERTRIRQQQERLIREQLKALAESLEPESRAEILRALEGDGAGGVSTSPDTAPDSSVNYHSDNQLADLAGILSRMSGLVTTQQSRLLGLLKELRAAMENQALLASLQQELEIARAMQLSILPRNAPPTDRVDITATMIPAREVGGDFYDYFLVDPDHLAFVVADVSGKGVPAAFFMAISRTLLKTNALFLRQPAKAVTQLNIQLCAENEQMMFVTMFFGVLDLRNGKLAYVNAGHNPPVALRHGGADYLPHGQNMALAVLDDQAFIEGEMTLAPGETLFLYTDGVTEAADVDSQLFGTARLMEVLGRGDAHRSDLPARVLASIREFEQGAPQADDITCVAMTYRGTRT